MVFPPPPDDPHSNNEPLRNLRDELPNLSQERIDAAKKQARRWFLILLSFGLVLGGLVAIGVVKILNNLGLTARPDHPLRLERPQK